MDNDEKIRKRKGNNRPIIPEKERYEFLSNLDKADYVVVKDVNEPKWGLIKAIKPDVLVAIKENYTDEQIVKLQDYCGRVAILPRQSETSTSDKIRKITISKQTNRINDLDEKITMVINEMKKRIDFTENMIEPIPEMMEQLKFSTDWVCPVAAACYYDGRWYFGTNQSDFNIPKYDVENRTELYYATTEHAEINMLKKMGNIEKLTPENVEEYTGECFTKEIKMPVAPKYKNMTMEQREKELRSIIYSGFNEYSKNFDKQNKKSYIDEIERNLSVIHEINHADYFLGNYEFIKRGKELGCMLSPTGRGSAVSFLVNFFLGFTKVDKMQSAIPLYAERFLSAKRVLEAKSLADIDHNSGYPEKLNF